MRYGFHYDRWRCFSTPLFSLICRHLTDQTAASSLTNNKNVVGILFLDAAASWIASTRRLTEASYIGVKESVGD